VISSLVGCDQPPWYDRLASALQHLVTGPRPPLGAQPADCWLAARLYNPPEGGVRAMVHDAEQLDPLTRAAVVRRACAAAVHSGWTPNTSDRIMSVEQLRQLVRDGHEIASHSRTHRALSQLDCEDIATEVAGSREELSQAIGREVNAFAYPGGDNDPEIVDAVRRAGYQWAVTTRYGLNNALSHPLRLNRVVVSTSRLRGPRGRDSMSMLRLELSGAGESLGTHRLDPHITSP
jgi:peptidoglycan/xylan/chitin deacetylase (PgdA/CDA1 family)